MKNLINYLFFLLFSCSLIFLWVYQVGPSPEPEALERVYWPILEYLRLSQEIGNDYFFIVSKCFRLNGYPTGVAMFSWLFAFLGLQNLVLSFPWAFTITIIIPFCLIPLFRKSSIAGFWLLALLFFFYPFSQICLKQFSVHAWSIIYAFVGILFFRSFLLKSKIRYLIAFVFCFFIAAATKHLGFLILANVVIVYLFWSIYTKGTADYRLITACFIIGLLAIFFYSKQSIYSYSSQQTQVLYTQHSGLSNFILMCVLWPSALCLISLITNFYAKYPSVTKFYRHGLLLLFFSLFASAQMLFEPTNMLINFIIIFGMTISVVFGFFTNMHSVRSFLAFLAINNFLNMSLLFASQIGRVSHVFFFPLLLMLFMTVSETRKLWSPVLLLIAFIVLSNFMPSAKDLKPFIGNRGGNNMIYIFYNTYHNPLAWQPCPIAATVKEIFSILERRHFSKLPLFLVQNVQGMLPVITRHFETFDENFLYNVPPLKINSAFDPRLKPRPYRELVQQWYQEGDVVIKNLILAGDLPLAVRIKPELPRWSEHPSNLKLTQLMALQDKEWQRVLFNESLMMELLNGHIFYLLDTDLELQKLYDIIPLPSEQTTFADFYILKSLPVIEYHGTPHQNLLNLVSEYRQNKGN